MIKHDKMKDFIVLLTVAGFDEEEIAEYCTRFLEAKEKYACIQDQIEQLKKLCQDFKI